MQTFLVFATVLIQAITLYVVYGLSQGVTQIRRCSSAVSVTAAHPAGTPYFISR